MIRATRAHLRVPVGPRDHVMGPATAPVTLLEYGDFECSHCGRAHPVVKALLGRLGGQMRFAYRHFPLSTVHPHAQHAAEAAEAAGAQGRFWEMHDVLFANQHALDDQSLAEYAAAIGLEVRQFGADLLEHVHAPKVREDFMSGVRSGASGTPTFFINGLRHDGPVDFGGLLAAVEEALIEGGG